MWTRLVGIPLHIRSKSVTIPGGGGTYSSVAERDVHECQTWGPDGNNFPSERTQMATLTTSHVFRESLVTTRATPTGTNAIPCLGTNWVPSTSTSPELSRGRHTCARLVSGETWFVGTMSKYNHGRIAYSRVFAHSSTLAPASLDSQLASSVDEIPAPSSIVCPIRCCTGRG